MHTGESEEQEYITTVASEQSLTVRAAVHAYQRLSHPFELASASHYSTVLKDVHA